MVINLYRNLDTVIGGSHNCGYYKTDASEEVINGIIEDLKKDDKLKICDFAEAVETILKARGYSCEEYKIKSFGY